MAATAGYSGIPLPRKLGIREGDVVALLDAPEGIEALLAPLPDGVDLHRVDEVPDADVILYFTAERADLATLVDDLARAIHPDGSLWVAWPKRASKVPTDMTEDVVREICLPLGLVDNKVCAIDATWSGLRLVWRVGLRGD